MSWSGQCFDCGKLALNENIVGISTHSGYAFKRWRQAMAASVGALLLDELAEDT